MGDVNRHQNNPQTPRRLPCWDSAPCFEIPGSTLDVLVHTSIVENRVLIRVPFLGGAKLSKACTRKKPHLEALPSFQLLFLIFTNSHNSQLQIFLSPLSKTMFNSKGVSLNSQSGRVSLKLYMYVHKYVSVFTVKLYEYKQ